MTAITNQEIFIRIGVSILIGTLIGIEREYKNRPAGMRTHVLVCLGACVVALIEAMLAGEMRTVHGGEASVSIGRMSAQVISGIGFLGAGTIFTARKKIAGLTTAASLWNVACLGLAVGMGYYLIAGFGCVCVIIVLLMLQRIVRVNAIKKVEIRFVHRTETIEFINRYFKAMDIMIMDLDFHVENKDNEHLYINTYTLRLPQKTHYAEIVNHLAEHGNIQGIRTTNT